MHYLMFFQLQIVDNTIMKNSILAFFICALLATACRAQQPIPKLSNNQIKIGLLTYNTKKESETLIKIINANNKLTNVKQVNPNVPSDVFIADYKKLDKNLITKICADAIPLNTLQQLPKSNGDYLYIILKIDTKGKPIEMEFVIRNTSLITANQIKTIEQNIMDSPFKVTFTHGIERLFTGSNYFSIDVLINYNDMLKAKQAN